MSAKDTNNSTEQNLAQRLLLWWDKHGRKDLPWQQPRTPYRVWISEIMLQQTQVTTVIPYFTQWMQDFPDVAALAQAPIDDVLHRWSGLGYYARARNAHKAAAIICSEHNGSLPNDSDALQSLPGIGRSTAGAIQALGFNTRAAILDGNVKRVLARHQGIEGFSGVSSVSKTFWAAAEAHTPDERVAHYTQAIMDLGATVCVRSAPACPTCPLHSDCFAHLNNRTRELPTKKPRKAIPIRHETWLWIENKDNEFLLRQNAPTGLWGGLWRLPKIEEAGEWLGASLAAEIQARCEASLPDARVEHRFTHFQLIAQVHRVSLSKLRASADSPIPSPQGVNESPWRWYQTARPEKIGLPAPLMRLIDRDFAGASLTVEQDLFR